MPKLKQPTSLLDIAMDKLVVTSSKRYAALTDEKTSDDIRRDIELMKNYLVSHVPLELYQRFRKRLGESIIDMYYSADTTIPGLHNISRIMMARIVGFEGTFLCCPDSFDIDFVTELKVTWLQDDEHKVIDHSLEVSDLYNLTTFRMTKNCTDAILESIGTNCPKLIKLDVSDSENVTDAGLRALSPCSNLRRVEYTGCSVSLQGIDDLFSVNGRLKHMAAWSAMRGFDLSDPSIHPAVEILKIHTRVANPYSSYLRSAVRKFPNLTTLSIDSFDITGDLYALSELAQLRKLSYLHLFRGVCMDWMGLKLLLGSIGTQILGLTVPCTDQKEIDSIYELCENIKKFKWLHRVSDLNMNKLVIPPFRNLTRLTCYNIAKKKRGAFYFGVMPQLKELWIDGFDMASELKAMIVDHERFPNLRKIRIEKSLSTNLTDRLRQIAKFNNLDVTIQQF